MLTTLIRRELLDNLMTFRFATTLLITLLLIVANTAVLIRDYDARLANYNTAVKTHQAQLQEMKTYSAGRLVLDRPPNPLSIFNTGLDKRLGNEIWVYHGYVPTLWDATAHGSDNLFLKVFASIDLVFIIEMLLSLMALIFAYDAIAGEREGGTLRLVLSHPVSRGHILFAKYISAMLCLLVPLLMSLGVVIILLTASGSISLSTDDFLRIGGIVFTSIAYLSVFYLIGMLISAATRRAGTALMFSMFVWGFLVLVYPNMILVVIAPQRAPEAPTASAFNQMKQVWEQFDTERKRFLANDAFPGEGLNFDMMGMGFESQVFDGDPSTLRYYYQSELHLENLDEGTESGVPHAQNYYSFLEPRIISTAEQTWLIRKPTLEDIFIQPANSERIWLRFSPAGMYDIATQAWAGTDLLGIQDFFEAVRQYRQGVIQHFYDKKVFRARQWFSADKGAVDWNSLPQFSFQRNGVEINTKRAFPDLFLLLIVNFVLFTASFLIFVKSEV